MISPTYQLHTTLLLNEYKTAYEPITPELAASGLLVPIREAAANEGASASTLKSNAKARRLCGYQAHFGAPVMVMASEVREFLKSRPDIASKYHPRNSPPPAATWLPPNGLEPPVCEAFPFPETPSASHTIDEFKVGITLRSLNHRQPAEIVLTANLLMEIGRQLLDLTHHKTQPQH